jgi:hypothetical protein
VKLVFSEDFLSALAVIPRLHASAFLEWVRIYGDEHIRVELCKFYEEVVVYWLYFSQLKDAVLVKLIWT